MARPRAARRSGAPAHVAMSAVMAAAALVAAACGATRDEIGRSDPGAAGSPAELGTVPVPDDDSAGASIVSTESIDTIGGPGVVDEPARRNVIELAWIGGSDSVWNDVDLPEAVVRRLPKVPGWGVAVSSTISIAAMPRDVMAGIDAAVERGADALVIPLNIAWLTWEEPACAEIADLYARYECVLSTQSIEIDRRNAEQLHEMIDAVVATGLPSLLYAMPHSTDALNDPVIGPVVAAAESKLASFDPGAPTVTFVSASFTRDRGRFMEGVDFLDMVHPTVSGAERLADVLMPYVAEIVTSARGVSPP